MQARLHPDRRWRCSPPSSPPRRPQTIIHREREPLNRREFPAAMRFLEREQVAAYLQPSSRQYSVLLVSGMPGGTGRRPDGGEPTPGLSVFQQLSGGHVGASTQNHALSALLFLYRAVLARDLGELPSLAGGAAGSILSSVALFHMPPGDLRSSQSQQPAVQGLELGCLGAAAGD